MSGKAGFPVSAKFSTYLEWEKQVPRNLRKEAIWNLKIYRSALFIGDLAFIDGQKLLTEPQFEKISPLLTTAAARISANIAEGYRQSSDNNRVRFYENALGSARETRNFYTECRHILGSAVVEHRGEIITVFIKQTATFMKTRQGGSVREEGLEYLLERDSHAQTIPFA